MSIPLVFTTFFVVTIPVAIMSFFNKMQKSIEYNYIALSDFKMIPSIFHSYPENHGPYKRIEIYPGSEPDSYNSYYKRLNNYPRSFDKKNKDLDDNLKPDFYDLWDDI